MKNVLLMSLVTAVVAPLPAMGGGCELGLLGTAWVASRYQQSQKAYAPQHPATLTIMATGLSGRGGCNTYQAGVQSPAPGQLAVGSIAATKMFCAESQQEEDDFFDILSRASRFDISFDGQTLVLSDSDNGGYAITLTRVAR